MSHGRGSQSLSDTFHGTLVFLGTVSNPAIVCAPEGKGRAEPVIRTLKERLLCVKSVASVEELRVKLITRAEFYNREWLIERHGFRPPGAARRTNYEQRV